MPGYLELMAQRERLNTQIAAALAHERSEAIQQIREKMASYEITLDELSGKRTARTTRSVVPPKYRDPNSGKTWSGRGKRPRWIQGDASTYLIVPAG